jgi:ankyrin repeat protein
MSLRKAARAGNAEQLQALLEAGKDPNATHEHGISGWTPLHSAAGEGEARCTELLLLHHAAVDSTDATGVTPLHRASGAAQVECCQLLLRAGARLEPPFLCEERRTPLHWAALAGATGVAKLLLASGALPTHRDSSGALASELAAAGGHAECAGVLREAEAAAQCAVTAEPGAVAPMEDDSAAPAELGRKRSWGGPPSHTSDHGPGGAAGDSAAEDARLKRAHLKVGDSNAGTADLAAMAAAKASMGLEEPK